MKYLIVIAMLFSLYLDEAPKPIKPKADIQTSILKEQLAQARLQAELGACQVRNWQGEFQNHQGKIQGLVDEAFKEASLDKKEYDLDVDKMEFVKKAQPDKKP